MITLATLPQATAQEIFDQVATHLLTQNCKSLTYSKWKKAHLPKYRGDNNTKCAIGCIISDDEYDPVMESCLVSDLLENIHNVPFELLAELQRTHDSWEPEEWKGELVKVAWLFQLDYSVVSKFKSSAS
jgi:hypothetical protein